MTTVSSLFIYPIKSCQGLSVLEMTCDERGPESDRRCMVIDDQGRFLTQRENPRLVLVQPHFDENALVVSAPGVTLLRLPDKAPLRHKVRIWDFQTEADDMGDECARWFSEVLDQSCRLVRFPDDVHRKVKKTHTDLDAEVAFSDGYPFLVLTLESLVDLNRRLDVPLPMNRFRPNIVLRDCQPFEEDEWKTIAFPDLVLDLVKPSPRCKITTLNPETLEYGKEPLRTLAKFRRHGDGVVFGQNAVHHGRGSIRIGDRVTIVSKDERVP